MTDQTFAQLGLPEPILRAVSQQGYETPTPIQCQAIPHLIAGRDLLGIAQTGTGKTAAFALPILDFLAADPQPPVARRPSVLVLTPTRELATQIGESFRVYGANTPVSHTVIFGGVPQGRQVRAMARGVDVLVATPGRLIDLMDQRHIDLCDIEVFVLDEADRMLDMGFLPAVRKVIRALPEDRQSVLFSATMPPDIVALTKAILRDPVRVEVTPQASTAERVDQRVLFVEKADKRKLLGEVLRDTSIERALVFTRTKHGADRVATHLRRLDVKVAAIHGDKSQGQRERALDGFRNGSVRVLVATDIAARGIDVPGISHVINFDLPNVPESYVHRIGRTARAGRGGTAISFCASDEHEYLRDIEKTIRQSVPRVEDHPYRSGTPFRSAAPEPKGKSQRHRKPNRNEAKAPAARRAKRGRSSRQRARSA